MSELYAFVSGAILGGSAVALPWALRTLFEPAAEWWVENR